MEAQRKRTRRNIIMQGGDNGLFLGLELGSTRIKAVAIDGTFAPVENGSYTWASTQENGIWTYPLEEAWRGMRAALGEIGRRQEIRAMGVSAMMPLGVPSSKQSMRPPSQVL